MIYSKTCCYFVVPFCQYHFVHTILSEPFCPYHFVRTILSIPFCPMTFCSYTILSMPFCPYHFVRYHFVRSPEMVYLPPMVFGFPLTTASKSFDLVCINIKKANKRLRYDKVIQGQINSGQIRSAYLRQNIESVWCLTALSGISCLSKDTLNFVCDA